MKIMRIAALLTALSALVASLSAQDAAHRASHAGASHSGREHGARVRDGSFTSQALGRAMNYRVIVPADYESSQRRYPVLYLLHGLSGDYRDWTTRTNLAEYTRALPLIVVMPDGGNQWYTNAADGSARFEHYILDDLPAEIVLKFRTINSRYGRSIAGLSMGGYGSLKMALKRPGAFAVAASFSGAFNATRAGELEPLIGKAEADRMQAIFGPAGSDVRRDNDLFALASAMKADAAPYIYIDCGIRDSALLAANREVVAALGKAGAAYEYHEVAGAHTWDFWDRRIREFLPVLMQRLKN